ncbi:putative RNA helicase [Helianthus annuus]|nr:putative RNA helicase [Helianthus annuus]
MQMSGRAGRRGKDERGICLIMIDEQMEMNTLKDMVLGKPAPLVSTFRKEPKKKKKKTKEK